MQKVCDVKGRFLDIFTGYPDSTSNYLAFVTSRLHTKLETPGFFALNLVLYRNNTHASNTYIVTPCKSILGSSKDICNFSQSHVKIRIECIFGILIYC